MDFDFSFPEIPAPTTRAAKEPKVPPLVGGDSFVFVQTTGLRSSPEALILELFREVFFSPVSHDGKERPLSPDFAGFAEPEQALLYATRGRPKQVKQGKIEGFYSPVYPEQARGGWFRKQSDRAIRHHFLEGALAHAMLRSSEPERVNAASIIVNALRGSRRATSTNDVQHKEFLSATMAAVEVDLVEHGMLSREVAVESLAGALGKIAKSGAECSFGRNDAFATRIKDDFLALCAMEENLPRLLWLDLLKSFLRLAVSAWILGRMKVTVHLRDWAMTAIESGTVATDQEIQHNIANRWEDLFHPTRTPTNELTLHVERFMKARVELNILLYLLESKEKRLFENLLTVESAGAKRMTVSSLLDLFKSMNVGEGKKDAVSTFRTLLVREAEKYPAWTNPQRNGQGKNIDEFLRVLQRFRLSHDDTGYLANKIENSVPSLAVIFPGPTMIRLVLMLAHLEKHKQPNAARGKLVLADLEKHFCSYGLDFTASAGARPRLLEELSRIGLLKGSPDACDYTELLPPIKVSSSAGSSVTTVPGAA